MDRRPPNDDPVPEAPGPAPAPRRPGARPLRWAVSLWLAFHVSAIIIAPASVAPSSDLVRSAWAVYRPYLQVLYLNHGYHFFAPEPDPSTLLAFAAERDDGTVVRGRIPDRAIQPRLLYHRHFMLTEHMARRRRSSRRSGTAPTPQHLGHKYGATRVSLTRQTHLLPTMEMVRQGVRLDDPASYTEQPLGVFRCDAF